VKRIAILVAGVALLAGCGGGSKGPTLYTKAATSACLRDPQMGIVVSPKVDFVASTASNGALHAHLSQNDVTVLFGASVDEANNLADAYRRFHAKNVGINDILVTQNNAVMLWRLHPSDADRGTVENCLK
jgi:hypothetical protein